MGQKEGKHRYVISNIIKFPSINTSINHFTYSLKYYFCFLIVIQTECVCNFIIDSLGLDPP